jgi:hypothetical protein
MKSLSKHIRRFFQLLPSLLILSVSFSGSAQEPCTIGLDKAPDIRGIKLGMTISELKILYPNLTEPKERDEAGTSAIYLQGIENEKLKGIESLFVHFFRGRVYHISARYKLADANEANEVAKLLDLPKKDYARTECQGFGASVFRYSDKTVSLDLTDTLAQIKVLALHSELTEKSAECQKLPVLRGISLGMSVAKFRGLYPSQVIRNRTEVGELVLRKISGDDARLAGITTLWAYFLDGALYFLVIDYSNQIEWKSIDQFVEYFSKATGLQTKWDGSFNDRTLRCERFIVTAELKDSRPRIKLQDRTSAVKLNKREETLKSPGTFRP